MGTREPDDILSEWRKADQREEAMKASLAEHNQVPQSRGSSSLVKFLTFRRMISGDIVGFAYICGAVILTGLAVRTILTPRSDNDYLTGVVMLTLGNLAWRLLCELLMILFAIYDKLISIDRKLSIKKDN